MGVRSRLTCAIALASVFTAIALPVSHTRWLNSRTFVALELPLSLSPGKVSSPDFKVNLAGWYQIVVDVDHSFAFSFDCGFGGSPPLLRTATSIYRNGGTVEQAEGADRFLGHFHAEPGALYRLDLEVLSDASCLNTGHPRIFVWTESQFYYQLRHLIWAVSGVLILCGLGLFAFSVAGRGFDDTQKDSPITLFEGTTLCYPSPRATRVKSQFTRIPQFGLLLSLTLGVIFLPAFLIYFYAWGYDHPSSGIRVQLIRPGPLRSPESVPVPLVLHVQCAKLGRPTLQLNARSVQPDILPDSLKLEFKTRAGWLVYITGDPVCDWQDVADVIDIVHTAGGQVVLFTANP